MSVKIPSIPRKVTIGIYFLWLILSYGISLLTLLFIVKVDWDVFTPLKYLSEIHSLEYLVEDSITYFRFAQNILSPFIILIIGFIYCLPLFKKRNDRNNIKVLNRISNIPIAMFLQTLFSWISTGVYQVFVFLSFNNKDYLVSTIILIRGVLPFFIGLLIGILLYYICDFINQFWLVPKFYGSGQLLSAKNTVRLSIRGRFLILFLATSILPYLFINIIAVSHEEIFITLLLYSIFFSSIALIITLFLSRVFTRPLSEMDNIARTIELGEYNRRVKVLTNDELGRLSNTINNMSIGLKERDRIKDTFGRIVDPVIRDHLLKSDINTGGEYYTGTVLFTDIRDFTTISETLAADKLIELLNRYFSIVTEVIEEEGGIVNKFIGDAVLAIFGAPVEVKGHSECAINAAVRIRDKRNLLNVELEKEGLPTIKTGTGVHTGQFIAGNIGSKDRMEFTAIGDTVNVAARLESSCKKLGKEIVISEESCLNYSKKGLTRLGRLKVKGREQAITVFSI